jgi:hypothetical protein
MKVIQPNCRIQFTAEDVQFIVQHFSGTATETECLTRLLADEESRDQILDDETLYRALLEHRGCLRVSSRFYFYVLVRHVLRQSEIEDRAVADYVAEMLAEFSRADRARFLVPGTNQAVEYFFEMLMALQAADDRHRFCIRAHIGNHSLFLSGVFPDRIRSRAEHRGFPDLKYYEALGRSSFRAARDHRLAERYCLASVFATLSDRFEDARLALNDVSHRLFSIGDLEAPLEELFRN